MTMKTYSPVPGASHGPRTDGAAGGRGVLWLLAVMLAGAACLACASSPPKQAEQRENKNPRPSLVCPHPRDQSACTPGPGLPDSDCMSYEKNRDWLPPAYVINATCVCQKSVDQPTAECAHAVIRAQTEALAQDESIREEGRLCNSKEGLERDECFEKHL